MSDGFAKRGLWRVPGIQKSLVDEDLLMKKMFISLNALAAHGHWCAFTDLYHTIPYHTHHQPYSTTLSFLLSLFHPSLAPCISPTLLPSAPLQSYFTRPNEV